MNQNTDHDTLPPSIDPATGTGTVEPPTTFMGIVRRLGPGLIIAGSIVGSGELIATTKTGAQAGIALLWLIIIGCFIKVFVQIELGRYSISHGETTLSALDRVPGPRLGVNWILWLWAVMILCTVGQLGGIVGGVGQAMAITFPIRGDYLAAIQVPGQAEIERFIEWEDQLQGSSGDSSLSERDRARASRGYEALSMRIEKLGDRGQEVVESVRSGGSIADLATYDDKIWAAVIAFLTAGLLFRGRYRMIQNISTVLVVSFTIITVGNVISLQMSDRYSIPLSEILRGLSFGAPEATSGQSPWTTALATFGIIGVGASELIAYPYWCLEKGYAKFAGQRTDDQAWVDRAQGWMKVMRCDAYASMVVYTIATLAFFLMGVAVLYNDGLDPEGMRMVSTLAEAYVPVFGTYAKWLFLTGAISVLYSTFLVANAANARMVTDAIKVFGLMEKHNEKSHNRSVAILSVVLPMLCLAVYCSGVNPVKVILIAGAMQAFMLPIIGFSSVYFRRKLTDPRLAPGKVWDTMLILSCIGLLVAGAYVATMKVGDLVSELQDLLGMAS